MTTTAVTRRWCGAQDPGAFSRWVADRAAGASPHLVPVTRVGRCAQGHLAAEILHPSTRALADTLDVLGVPTEGVAVTLTVPLLALAARARSGAIELGAVPIGAVRVDDAGAIVVADRPPGAAVVCTERRSVPVGANGRSAVPHAGADVLAAVPDAGADVLAAAPDGDLGAAAAAVASTLRTAPAPPPVHPLLSPRDLDGPRQLVTAARAVWDRVDPRSPARPVLDTVLDAARDGDARAITDALDRVVEVAPPRPVRWSRPGPAFPVEDPADDMALPVGTGDLVGTGALVGTLARVARDVVERGVPLGRVRRIPLRHVLVGTVVTGGLVTAAASLL